MNNPFKIRTVKIKINIQKAYNFIKFVINEFKRR